MKIKQFKDAPLSHFSYALVSNGEMALVDPSRNPVPYYKYAEEENAKITAVFETHPHADFVSGHLQISKETGATIYISEKVGVNYPHRSFDEGDSVKVGNVTIKPIFTPGHSPDSLTFHAFENDEHVLFTGDTLFIGDVGRPDLREKAGNMKAKRKELAKMMYHSIQNKFKDLPNDAKVYPAHGAGSLCGKNMSDADSSTLGNERIGNWAFKDQTEDEFVSEILKDQPFIPSYFGFDVDLNREGADNIQSSKYSIPLKLNVNNIDNELLVVDTRDEQLFKKDHLPNSINIMARGENDKFETWLGAIIEPDEQFNLVLEGIDNFDEILERVAKIGYEKQLKGIFTLSEKITNSSEAFDLLSFDKNKEKYTIIDIRNASEVLEGKIFENAHNIPLNELRKRIDELPKDKPMVVHCAGGYRSAAGSSILESEIDKVSVYDLSEDIKKYKS
ncbi:glyoxylase-like metal-dependent hydrolase (beta-lactamase superfamily II) [Gillisia sp. Hel_I_86]|uniref:rhodanese-like domain-containing protein n=1 Tax=Gillisia sp. Hel_I_86 TaxID=1249981 RepID=UPI00119C4DFE|nr:rhodanese-like domain-containing protein [Gillisia sp. Hel_I_86]TVZ27079.1 glyoxylase-like metal-dependent hydrolase (beta-lactamase superfamily II) [Gillisia sp. Hel_I_86]